MNCLGADYYSSGSKIDKLSTYRPGFNGEKPTFPYIADDQLYYSIGIKAIKKTEKQYNVSRKVYIEPPWAKYTSPKEIEENKLMEKLDFFDFKKMKKEYINKQKAHEIFEKVTCIGTMSSFFMICSYLRGMENFLLDMAYGDKMAEYITKTVKKFCLEFNKRELEILGNEADYYGTWDDVAGQTGMLFSPDLFKKYILPYYKDLIENVKKYDLPFGWHCCGSIHDVLPLMINAGIDVFDVVQTSAKNMNLENIYNLYGNDIAFHGGIDVQKLLINKKPKDIKNEANKIVDLWGKRGGIILAPSHEIQPGTPIENILAIYKNI